MSFYAWEFLGDQYQCKNSNAAFYYKPSLKKESIVKRIQLNHICTKIKTHSRCMKSKVCTQRKNKRAKSK